MSKKVISVLLSAAMLVAMVCVGFGAVTAAAEDNMTYYFLAPTDYFNTDKGAFNTTVGAYWWQPEAPAAWPGVAMTAAPEIGENVYKIEGMAEATANIIFNSFADAKSEDPKEAAAAHQTTDVNTEGYDADCPYDESVATDDFNGWIYVLKLSESGENEFSGATTTGGAWFTLDNYKNYADYYGAYGLGASGDTTGNDTTTTPDTPAPVEVEGAKGSADGTIVYKAGDVLDVPVQFGHITEGPIAAYNYTISYDPEFVEVVMEDDEPVYDDSMVDAKGATTLVNDDKANGKVEIGFMASKGAKNDVSGDPTTFVTVQFKVKKDASKLGFQGQCTSLSVIKDGEQVAILTPNGVKDGTETDNFSNLDYKDPTPTPVDNTSSKEPTNTSSKKDDTSSKTESTKDDKNSSSSKKSSNDNASSSKSSSNANSAKGSTTTNNGTVATVQTAGTFAVVSLVVILMAAAAVVLYTRKKTEE